MDFCIGNCVVYKGISLPIFLALLLLFSVDADFLLEYKHEDKRIKTESEEEDTGEEFSRLKILIHVIKRLTQNNII